MITLFNILEGALDNAKEYGLEVTSNYTYEYALNSLEVSLSDEQIKLIVDSVYNYDTLCLENPALITFNFDLAFSFLKELDA